MMEGHEDQLAAKHGGEANGLEQLPAVLGDNIHIARSAQDLPNETLTGAPGIFNVAHHDP